MKTFKRALIIVDPTNDFMPDGSLPVKGGNEIIPLLNDLMDEIDYDFIVVTQDWHPENHCSFKKWPVHCVLGTKGAEIHQGLNLNKVDLILRKGKDSDVDYHSAFYSEVDSKEKRRTTGLAQMLKALKIDQVDVTGLAFEVCVKLTALDSQSEGFKTRVLKAYTRSIFPINDTKNIKKMEDLGVEVVKDLV